jgi:hypothetical protein
MNGRILDSLTVLASDAFAVVPFIALLLFIWPRNWFRIWQRLDALLRVTLTSVQKKFLPHKNIVLQQWNDSFAERVFILRFTALLIVFVTFFPFGSFSPFIEGHRGVCVQLLGCSVTNETPFRYWEIAVFLWCAIFFIFVQYRDGKHYAKAILRSDQAYDRGFVWMAIFIMVIGVLYYFIVKSESPSGRLLAELVLVLLFCIQDLVFMRKYSRAFQDKKAIDRDRLYKTSDNYFWFLLLLDLPGLFAFTIVLVFLVHCQHMTINQDWQAPFASGAAALNLLLLNVVYSALAVWQKYLDAELPAVAPAAPPTNLNPEG